MLCYKDKTFCKSDCIQKGCHRFFSEEIREGATKWMGENAPIAFSDFSDTCPGYTT